MMGVNWEKSKDWVRKVCSQRRESWQEISLPQSRMGSSTALMTTLQVLFWKCTQVIYLRVCTVSTPVLECKFHKPLHLLKCAILRLQSECLLSSFGKSLTTLLVYKIPIYSLYQLSTIRKYLVFVGLSWTKVRTCWAWVCTHPFVCKFAFMVYSLLVLNSSKYNCSKLSITPSLSSVSLALVFRIRKQYTVNQGWSQGAIGMVFTSWHLEKGRFFSVDWQIFCQVVCNYVPLLFQPVCRKSKVSARFCFVAFHTWLNPPHLLLGLYVIHYAAHRLVGGSRTTTIPDYQWMMLGWFQRE